MEIFAYTHYPVRLNRKNGMVYVFRSNKPGGVLAVKWSDVYWVNAKCTRSRYGSSYDYEIRGHILDADGVTVRDTFNLGQSDTDLCVAQQWEHFKDYMETGQAKPAMLLPIARHKERFWFGMRRLASNVQIDPAINFIVLPLLSPLWASAGWARGLAMLTCRQPRWPADVEAACAVRPGEEMRKKDKISATLGDTWIDRVVLVISAFIGGACGAYFWYWVITASGFARLVMEMLMGKPVV